MKNTNKILTCIIAIFAMSNNIDAQSKQNDLPGDTTLPSSKEDLQKVMALEKGDYKYKIENFFKRPAQSSFRFSPNGDYISYKEKDINNKNHVYIKSTKTDKITKVILEGVDLISAYGWANENRLLYMKDKGGDENYHLFAVDIDGKNSIELTPFDGVKARMLDNLKDQDDYIIISMNKENKQTFEPYKINIVNGKYEKLFENNNPENPITGYDFDKDGNLKAYTQQQNGTDYVLYYKSGKEKEFKKIRKNSWKDDFSIIDFDYTSKNKDLAYVATNINSDKLQIVLYDFKENKEAKKIFSNDMYDVSGISFAGKLRGYEVDYYHYTGDKNVVVPVSKAYKKIHEKFSKKFAGIYFKIVSVTDKEDKFLIYAGSDKLYGTYYFYNKNKDSFKEIFNLMPSLNPDDMAEMRPIKFKSRDGLTIHGYLTVPNNIKGKKIPLIVNPHGGPYGVRDGWGFNPEVQLFASRGYATLKINYRGSGGYGKKFLLAGNKQIGRKMLNDLEDGVAYAKTLDFIDKNKVAIYGASYGGLATLGSLVKTPDLYTCGVDYVGVSNLFTFFKSFPPYWKPYLKQIYEQWYDENSPEDQEIMKKVSPALNIDKINKPLFVVQGANDPRVNINESDQMVKNLREKGFDIPYMVKYNEGHGFNHEDNRIELYKTMMGFFAKNLK